jgi:hypothetical protein
LSHNLLLNDSKIEPIEPFYKTTYYQGKKKGFNKGIPKLSFIEFFFWLNIDTLTEPTYLLDEDNFEANQGSYNMCFYLVK